MQELQELSALAETLKSTLPDLLPPPDDQASARYRQEALLSIRFAADLTRGYIARLDGDPGRRTAHGSLALKHAWSSAGVELHRYDPELARRCVLKAFYWSSPDAWSQEEANHTSLAFEEVSTTVADLLSVAKAETTGWNRVASYRGADPARGR